VKWQYLLLRLLKRIVGTYGYEAGSGAETVNPPVGARLLEVHVYANGGDTTVRVAGGDIHTVKSGIGQTISFAGQLIAPAVIFTANSIWWVSWLEGAE